MFPTLIAETADWWVVDKPSGWLTIPGRDTDAPVLSAWADREAGCRLYTVHRIDRETSGVVLFARTAEAHRRAGIWFQRHECIKYYDAIAAGVIAQPMLRLNAPIEGASALSQVEVRETFDCEGGASLVRVRIVTGRRHQIRIHLSGAGHPVWGDTRHGGPARCPRVALHAASLQLPSGEKFESPWPDDFKQWVCKLREPARV